MIIAVKPVLSNHILNLFNLLQLIIIETRTEHARGVIAFSLFQKGV
jgi:hypothetical protein